MVELCQLLTQLQHSNQQFHIPMSLCILLQIELLHPANDTGILLPSTKAPHIPTLPRFYTQYFEWSSKLVALALPQPELTKLVKRCDSNLATS